MRGGWKRSGAPGLQPTNSNVKLLQCYGIFSTSFDLTSTKVKTHPNPAVTQHIRDRSRKTATPQVHDGAGTLASPPLMLKHKTVIYFALPHKFSIIVCLQRPSGKKRITQESVH